MSRASGLLLTLVWIAAAPAAAGDGPVGTVLSVTGKVLVTQGETGPRVALAPFTSLPGSALLELPDGSAVVVIWEERKATLPGPASGSLAELAGTGAAADVGRVPGALAAAARSLSDWVLAGERDRVGAVRRAAIDAPLFPPSGTLAPGLLAHPLAVDLGRGAGGLTVRLVHREETLASWPSGSTRLHIEAELLQRPEVELATERGMLARWSMLPATSEEALGVDLARAGELCDGACRVLLEAALLYRHGCHAQAELLIRDLERGGDDEPAALLPWRHVVLEVAVERPAPEAGEWVPYDHARPLPKGGQVRLRPRASRAAHVLLATSERSGWTVAVVTRLPRPSGSEWLTFELGETEGEERMLVATTLNGFDGIAEGAAITGAQVQSWLEAGQAAVAPGIDLAQGYGQAALVVRFQADLQRAPMSTNGAQ